MQALFTLFRQAWQNAPLSPQERGLLRAIKSGVVSALISAVIAAAGLLTNWQVVTPQIALGAVLAAFTHTLVDSVAKYQAASAEVAQTAPSSPVAATQADPLPVTNPQATAPSIAPIASS